MKTKTEKNRPWGVHTIFDICGDTSVGAGLPDGRYVRAIPEPYSANRLVAAWWVFIGRAYAIIWPKAGELEAALGVPERKQKRERSTVFGFIDPHDGPVIPGLEKYESVYAKDQPQYRPVRTLPCDDGNGAVMRLTPTDAQRRAIAEGADLYLELLHFRGPLAPSLLMVMSEPADTDDFRMWWKAQTSAPYTLLRGPRADFDGQTRC